MLDLTDPLIAISVCWCLVSQISCISGIRSILRDVAHIVLAELPSPFSWRIDTYVDDDSRSANGDVREMVIRWAEGQSYIAAER